MPYANTRQRRHVMRDRSLKASTAALPPGTRTVHDCSPSDWSRGKMRMDSPFKDILHTNAVPSDADCQRIRAFLVGPRTEAEELTLKIGRIQAMLDDLTRKRDQLVNFIDAHLALVSPVRRLPDDVVQEIFEASLPSKYAVMDGAESPLLLCQVCRPWRRLALLTPRLWASLHVAAPPPSDVQKMNDAVNAWISRSGSVPLSLSFVASQEDTLDYDVLSMIKTFVGVANRWENIRLLIRGVHNIAPLAVLSPDDVPMLQSAVVEEYRADDSSEARTFLPFMGTPTLRRVALMDQEPVLHSLPLYWQTLSHLSIHSHVEVREALAVLQQSPKLETCQLCLQPVEGPISPRSCHLEHLSQLCVIDWSCVGISLFRALVLPSLCRLEYTCYSVVEGPLPFLNLLSLDNCLKCLSLNIEELLAESLLEALRLVPMLQDLHMARDLKSPINGWGHTLGIHPSVISLLMPGSLHSTDMLCPRLRSIHLLHASISDDGLLQFIRSRTGPHLTNNNHLSHVHIKFDHWMQVDIMLSLQVLIANGLNISLRYNYSSFPLLGKFPYSPSNGNVLPSMYWAPLSTMWNMEDY
ncbi:hypothetical protein B0H10DRAFT_734392 [Mycena sp. CBHHK59/15]|nr:hypothetical protein B0H10DRAFT_734392 [Mycena sp. CBHHK59/15]